MEKEFDSSPGATAVIPAPSPPPPQGTMLLEVKDVFVHFGQFAAVRGASFSLHAGNLLGLIGPNGAGKTTLLRAIATLQATSAGSITMLGERVYPGNEEAARLIGFTPDTPPLYDSLTVRQFLEFIAAGYGLTPENTGPAIDFWLEKVWLTDKAKQKIKGLSRGMKQRLGIARTLLPNPTIILLDEPAAGLDPAGRAQFRKLLVDLRDQGKTLIVSSHFLADMEEYCTHIAIMSQGVVQQFGSIREVASGKNDGRCRYTLDLFEPLARVEELLASIEGVSHVEPERLKITLEYWSDREKAGELLRTLVARNIPLSGFAANAGGLEEAYLRTATRQVD